MIKRNVAKFNLKVDSSDMKIVTLARFGQMVSAWRLHENCAQWVLIIDVEWSSKDK